LIIENYNQIIFSQLKFLSLKSEIMTMKKHFIIILFFISVFTYAEKEPTNYNSNQINEQTINLLEKKINLLEKDIDTYKDLIDKQYVLIGIIVGLICVIFTIEAVVIPIVLTQRREQNVDEQIEDLKEKITKIVSIEKGIIKIRDDIRDIVKISNDTLFIKLFSDAHIEQDPKKAIELYTELIVKYPNIKEDSSWLADAYKYRGDLYRKIGEYKNAINDLKEALRLDSTSATILYTFGHIYLDIEDYDKAIEYYSRAIKIDLQFEDCYTKRSFVYQRLAEQEKDPIKKREYDENAKKDNETSQKILNDFFNRDKNNIL